MEHLLEAEQRGYQMGDDVAANERGFSHWDGEIFETRDVFEAWPRSSVPVV